MVKSVRYNSIIAWLKGKEPKVIPTLGRKSHLTLSIDGNQLLVTGSTGRSKIINEEFWDQVCSRIKMLQPDNEKAGRYADIYDSTWKNPGYYYAPSVPATCRAYWEEKAKK
ncbi:MAG: hypothetical protein IKX26_01800 [Bacteroidales bacterium]|nr:hypothetical protein [Bacteroidales bacterium]